jgi:glycerol uptake facilitator-like aquaporin
MSDLSYNLIDSNNNKVLFLDNMGQEGKSEAYKSFISLLKKSIAEGIAYFFVILAIYLSQGDYTKFVFAFWCIFMVFGNVSGAHVNPIISLGLWIYKGNMLKQKNLIRLISYVSFQFLFGIGGAATGYFLYKEKVVHIIPGKDVTAWDIFICESFFSGTLLFVCLFITSPATRPSDKNYVNLGLISAWLLIIINAGINISGGCYNPTIYLVLNGLAYFTDSDLNALDRWWIYLIAPIVGSIVFTLIFKYIFKPYYISKNKIVISEDDDDD